MKQTVEKPRRFTLGQEATDEVLWKLGRGIPEAVPAADYESSPYHDADAVTRYAGAITVAKALATLMAHNVIKLEMRVYNGDGVCYSEQPIESPKRDDAADLKKVAQTIAAYLMKNAGIAVTFDTRIGL